MLLRTFDRVLGSEFLIKLRFDCEERLLTNVAFFIEIIEIIGYCLIEKITFNFVRMNGVEWEINDSH